MARPKTKTDLIQQSKDNFKRLFKYIDSLDTLEQQKEFPPGTMNRNIRDVLMHLHHWHEMMLNWYKIGMKGSKPEMPAKGYTWKTTPLLNKWICENYKNVSLDSAKDHLNSSFIKVNKIIEEHSDEELFEKKRYPWTGTTSLGAYLISATSSHYEWAFKLIKRAKTDAK